MILLEEETLQRPKLDTIPANVVIPGSSERPPSPNPTLPGYEASQAQHLPPHKRRFYRRLWQSKAGKLISYALAIYSAVFIVIGIPAFALVGPFKLFSSCVDPSYLRDGDHHTGSDGMAMTRSKTILDHLPHQWTDRSTCLSNILEMFLPPVILGWSLGLFRGDPTQRLGMASTQSYPFLSC